MTEATVLNPIIQRSKNLLRFLWCWLLQIFFKDLPQHERNVLLRVKIHLEACFKRSCHSIDDTSPAAVSYRPRGNRHLYIKCAVISWTWHFVLNFVDLLQNIPNHVPLLSLFVTSFDMEFVQLGTSTQSFRALELFHMKAILPSSHCQEI